MTDDVTQRLDEIEQRAVAATPGPWEVHAAAADARHVRADGPRDLAGVLIKILVADVLVAEQDDPEGQVNAEFIAHAREDVPWLVGRLRAALHAERAEAELRRLRDTLSKGRQSDESWSSDFFESQADLAIAEATIARVREAVANFCHGEQAYAEHQHYCVPILAALDGEGSS